MSLLKGCLNYIEVKFRWHELMRYDTLGDYYYVDYENCIRIDISKAVDREEQLQILVHELIEMILVEKREIGFESVDKWDLGHTSNNDPGSMKKCPYRKEHLFAMKVEKMLRKEMKREVKCLTKRKG
jgi:hypothetical protein